MKLEINGRSFDVESDGDTPLLWVLRDELGLTGTKYGCGLAQCGACSVLLDGAVVRSCVMPVEAVAGHKITTIEAITEDAVGRQVVDAWVGHQVPQCGYCQSGQVMAATALLKQVAHPTQAQIDAAMTNLCRCGTYNAISAAVHEVAGLTVAAAGPTKAPPAAPAAEANHTALGAAAAAVVVVGAGVAAAMQRRKAAKASNSEEAS